MKKMYKLLLLQSTALKQPSVRVAHIHLTLSLELKKREVNFRVVQSF